MGLIFHAKLTVCFISNIYAGFKTKEEVNIKNHGCYYPDDK